MHLPRVVVAANSRSRPNLASLHLCAAQHFRDQAAAIEAGVSPSKSTFAPPEYVHYWSGAIVFAVMALEAQAYELMTFSDRFEGTVPPLSFAPEDHWREVLERYCLVHERAMGKRLDTGRGIAQATKVLVKLRNELVHSKSEWRDDATVSRALRSACRNRFALNPFLCGEAFFPDQCISASCAAWAVRTAEAFLVSFAKSTKCRLNVQVEA